MIYVVLHNPSWYPNLEFYAPIRVGSAKFPLPPMINDSNGINISDKNSNYSELTAIYFLFKNCSDDVKGLVHYRRYFINGLYINKTLSRFSFISEKNTRKYLSNYDIIVPKAYIEKNTLYTQYDSLHYIKDLELSKQIVITLYPSYKESFEYVIETDQIHYRFFYNMFISSNKIFNEYCEWLFSILFVVEKKIDLNGYDSYQRRVFGFLSERLFNVYVYHNRLKYKEVEVVNVESYTISSLITSILTNLKLYSISRRVYKKFKGEK
jgi:hypothetical protein